MDGNKDDLSLNYIANTVTLLPDTAMSNIGHMI